MSGLKSIGLNLFCSLVLLLMVTISSLSQTITGTISGTVTDSNGGIIPGAKVTLTNRNTGVAIERLSDPDGNYEFFTVRIGAYLVSAEKPGFSI